MTLTLTAFDNSPEADAFREQVIRQQGRITGIRYVLSKSPAICQFTAHCPEQPELLKIERNPNGRNIRSSLTPPKP